MIYYFVFVYQCFVILSGNVLWFVCKCPASSHESSPKLNYAAVVAGGEPPNNPNPVHLTREQIAFFKGRREYQLITVEAYYAQGDDLLIFFGYNLLSLDILFAYALCYHRYTYDLTPALRHRLKVSTRISNVSCNDAIR